MLSALKRSTPLALGLMAAALASAQSIDVQASYRDLEIDAEDGGTAANALYAASVDHNDGNLFFQRATASADFRTAKLIAQVDGNGSANARATVQDTLEIDRPDGLGGLGLAYVRIRAHADTNANPVDGYRYDYAGASGQSTAQLSFNLGQNSFAWKQQTDAYSLWEQEDPGPEGETWTETRAEYRHLMPDGSFSVTNPVASGGDFVLPVYFAFGAPMDLGVSASVRAYLFDGGTVDTDFSHTYQWKGIDAVYAVGGDGTQTPVTGYSAMGGSGTDYAAPVPEPASLLALGAGALSLLRRRNARTQPRPASSL